MSTAPVAVERFARVFVKGPEELPTGADTYHDPDRGYYFKLHLDDVSPSEATPLIQKANERFDVELVRRVTRGDLYKERVYIDHPSEAPPDKRVQEGPNGGLFYETGVERVGVEDGETRNVAMIHWEDVEIGDEIVYETPDGEETFAQIVEIEEEDGEADVIHVDDPDNGVAQALPGTYTVDKSDLHPDLLAVKLDSAAHNAVYSPDLPDVCRLCDNERQEGSMLCEECADTEKDCDGHHVGPGVEEDRSLAADDVLCEVEDTVVDRVPVEEDGVCPACGEEVSDEDLAKDAEDVWVYYIGPQGGEGWMNQRTGEIRYQKQRPGKAPEGGDGYGEWLGEGWMEPPEDITDLSEGQTAEFYSEEYDEFVEGTVNVLDEEDGQFAEITTRPGDPKGLVGPAGQDELTAVEEVDLEGGEWEVGDEVHIRTDDLPESDPGYEDYEGEIGDVVVHNGDPLYQIVDDNGVVVDEFTEGELERYAVEDDASDESEGSDDGLEDGDLVEVVWEDDAVPDEPIEAEVEHVDGELGFRVQGGPYDGAWVHADEVDLPSISAPDDSSEGSDVDDFGAITGAFDSMDEAGEYEGEVVEYLDPETGEVEEGELTATFPSMDAVHIDGVEDPVSYEHVRPSGEDDSNAIEGGFDSAADADAHVGEPVEYVDPDTGEIEQGELTDTEPALDAVRVDGVTGPLSPDLVRPSEGSGGSAATPDEEDLWDGSVEDLAPGDEIAYESYGQEHDVEVTGPAPDDDAVMIETEDGDEFAVYEDEIVEGPGGDDGVEIDPDPAEEEFLAEHGIEPGQKFYWNGIEAVVTGATSLTQDGDLSDVEAYVPATDGEIVANVDEVVDNAQEDAEEDEPDDVGQTPSEDEAASAVAEPASGDADSEGYSVAEYEPDDVEEWRDLSDIGANHGNSMSAMEVGVLPDDSKAVHVDISHPSVSESDIEREMVGYEAGKHLDEHIPDHNADIEAGWAASEVAPGVDAKDATPEMKAAVDEQDFVDMAAKQVLLGNSDLHQNNLRVDEEGNLYPFDLDRSAGDVQGSWVGNLTQYDDTLDRILGELGKAATALGIDDNTVFREQILDRAQEVAEDLDEDTIDAMYEDASEYNSEFASTIMSNVSALKDGEVEL